MYRVYRVMGLYCLMLLSFFTPLVTSIRTSSAQFGEIITGYYSPCRYGTEGTVTTWHGQNRDGQPPYDPTRRTYDFRCQDKTIHAPHEGVVWGVTPRFGGVILIDDRANEVCMVFLGMHGFGVEPNQTVRTGTYLGFYGHAFHLSAVDGYCADANWYDVAARERERPVIWEEFGEVLRPDIQKTEPVLFISQNPGGGPAFYLSILDNVGFEMK